MFLMLVSRARRPSSGTSLGSPGGRERCGGEAIGAGAVHVGVPGGQHTQVPGLQGREGRRGRA